MPITDSDLENRFAHHQADESSALKHDNVRFVCREAAKAIVAMTPSGREQSLAVTALQEAMMWANTAIAGENPVAAPKTTTPDGA